MTKIAKCVETIQHSGCARLEQSLVQSQVNAMREDYNEVFKGRDTLLPLFDVQVERCRRDIRKYFPRKTVGFYTKRGSYGFKHDFENDGEGYVAEQAAIAAFLLEGFNISGNQNLSAGVTLGRLFNVHGSDYRAFKKVRRDG